MGLPTGHDGESRHGIAPSRARSGLPGKFAFHQALQPGERAKVQCLGEMPSERRATAIKPDTGYSALPARKSINAKSLALGLLFWLRSADRAASKIIQHEQTDCGGQVALLAIVVDLADQFGQRHVSKDGNFLHAV